MPDPKSAIRNPQSAITPATLHLAAEALRRWRQKLIFDTTVYRLSVGSVGQKSQPGSVSFRQRFILFQTRTPDDRIHARVLHHPAHRRRCMVRFHALAGGAG